MPRQDLVERIRELCERITTRDLGEQDAIALTRELRQVLGDHLEEVRSIVKVSYRENGQKLLVAPEPATPEDPQPKRTRLPRTA